MRALLRNVLLTALTVFALSAASVTVSVAAGDVAGDGEQLHSLLGSYLAANFAKNENDPDHAAAFYRDALSQDPGNEVLLEQAFQAEASEANWDRAVGLAEELVAKDNNNRIAHLVLGLSRFKSGDYAAADKEFEAASDGPVGELTSALARAWNALAAGKPDEAAKYLDKPKQAEWAQIYLNFHKALIADIAGKKQEAKEAYERSFKQESPTLRIPLAYARHAANEGDLKLAKTILEGQTDKSQDEPHVLVRELRNEIDSGKKVPLLITTPAEGMAEAFYGLGELLTGEGGVNMGVLYLQMALYVVPDHAFSLATLASAYESMRRYDDAIAVYNRIPPGTALQEAIDIRKAFDFNSLEKVDEAKATLDKLAADNPKDIKPLDALGNIMRSRKRYAEAVDYYTRAVALLPNPSKRHWSLYYSRGTSYERLKNWPAAEADLQKALKLFPDQPLALNYLGYSWVDQNRNLKQGMALIERAVALKPGDGYIVDSLGWAHYKLGNYKEAVRFLERAVEITPQDPVLNDHLGDALWRVGREREAKFQWDQSLTLDPEPEDAEKIKKKLTEGLPPTAETPAHREAQRNVHLKKRKETKLNSRPVE
jgi:tetratricopeptide (TPR) repeat protein